MNIDDTAVSRITDISESYSSHYDGDADYIYNDNVYDFKNNTGRAFVLLLIIMT